ncbi:ABC transporter permease [Hufsiella ginkgonis]|uniref:FtsX-like permease family protein n=1 Tax=Hufsiella ginkgonis TaxID=2695274 RepID=A0A7K1XT77_9SPHI|nr:ABC transporter permease [Hufsiella ginkgonis]MXV13979.1 FtsX-like permease family protein [Hufsiella ginkgonis]
MLKSYFKIALRNLWKHKLFSFINIFGLAAGMAVSLLALIDLKSAYDYDLFHPYPEQTYRIITDLELKEGKESAWASTPIQVGNMLRKYSFTKECVQVFPARMELSTETDMLPQELSYVDPDFFRVFGFRLQRGSFSGDPYTIVIDQATATRFFGKKDPIGKTLKRKTGNAFTVTGILAKPAGKTHFDCKAFAAASTLREIRGERKPDSTWSEAACFTYVRLKDGISRAALDKVLPAIGTLATKEMSASVIRSMGFRAQQLAAISPDREGLLVIAGHQVDMSVILVQIGVGLVTLLLAGFNYVNLTLARSLTRAREVGVRKVIGARKWHLWAQFVVESMILSAFALLLSIGMLQPLQSLNVVKKIVDGVQWDAKLWIILVSFTLVAGLLAGLVPARLLASFSPVMALKGQNKPLVFKGLTLRKVLVVSQFAISLTGIIFMLVMYRQMNFMGTGQYGFTKSNILNIGLDDKDARIVTAEVLKQPGIEQVTASSGLMALSHPAEITAQTADKQVAAKVCVQAADANFVPVFGLTLLAGDNLPASASDSAGTAVLLNERAIAALHLRNPAEAIGQLVWLSDSVSARVSGVVKDFHFMSMKYGIDPLMIRYQPKSFRLLQVKVSASAAPEQVVAGVSQRLAGIIKPSQQEIRWYEQELYDHHFHAEDQLFIGVFTGMVLSIACLGLLGMVTYTSEVRTKEVGIRKVMGATVSQVVFLLSRDFIWLLCFAALIAFPAGITFGMMFLRNYAYHASIGVFTVLSGFVVLFVIGGLTIGWQTFRTAASNPVRSLRNE